MRDIEQLHPSLQELIIKLNDKCNKQGLEIGISECLRTAAEQNALYAQGRTKSGSIVTNANGSSYSSMHQWGIAFDFYRNDGKGAYYDSDGFFSKVGKIGQQIGLEWGGAWTSIKDKPHFQLPNWGSTASKLKSLYGTPVKFIATWNKGITSATVVSSTFDNKEWTKKLQKVINAKVDGIAGNETLSKTPTIKRGTINVSVIKLIQEKLQALGYVNFKPNGKYGNAPYHDMYDAVIKYQKEVVGLSKPDGEFTSKGASWKKILGLK